MTQRGQRTTFNERIEIGERCQAGQTDPAIAQAMSISVWTVRKWRRKYQRDGRSGLASRMGRPATGALGHEVGCVLREIDYEIIGQVAL